jgi:hypothetical protein
MQQSILARIVFADGYYIIPDRLSQQVALSEKFEQKGIVSSAPTNYKLPPQFLIGANMPSVVFRNGLNSASFTRKTLS